MCISPISIPNPNYGKNPEVGSVFSLKDCSSAMISVPCGHCDECISLKQMYLVQRVQMESIANHVFFCTITYNNDMLPVLVTSSGHEIRYTRYSDLSNMFKRLRKDNAFGVPFRYLAVTERGSKRARPHAHILFFVSKVYAKTHNDLLNLEVVLFSNVLKYWSRNTGTNRKPVYVPLCTYVRKFIRGKLKTSYDLHVVLPRDGSDCCSNVAFYCLKYMLKGSNHDLRLQQALKLNYSDVEYQDIWKEVRSRILVSKGFGLSPDKYISRSGIGVPNSDILVHLRNGIDSAKLIKSDYPLFFNSDTGQTFPLSPYYKRKGFIYSFNDALDFYFNKNDDHIDSPIIPDDNSVLHHDDISRYVNHSKLIHQVSDELCDADCFDELFN